MSLFRRQRPDGKVLQSLAEHVGRRPRVLGWGSGPKVFVVALPSCLCWRFGEEPWNEVPWQRVRTGGWNADRSEMWWRLVDGTREKLVLDAEGTFPTAFRERVQASITVQKRVELSRGRAVVISGRRGLGTEEGDFSWDVMPVSGARLDDEETKAEVDQALAQIKADYDF